MNEDDPDQVQRLEPTGDFSKDLCDRLIGAFGSDGAWLLLSMLRYGWRAHFDLATTLVRGGYPPQGEDMSPHAITDEFLIVRDLQVQASLFAAAEQYATLLRAARRHRAGEEMFFSAYVGSPTNLHDLLRANDGMTKAEAWALLGSPQSALLNPRWHSIVDGRGEEVVVAGLVIPPSAVKAEIERGMVAHGEEVIRLVMLNASESLALVEEREAPNAPVDPRPLREIDNAYRHGLRVLLHSCVPEVRHFRPLGENLPEASVRAADLYMPDRKDRGLSTYGTVTASISHNRAFGVDPRALPEDGSSLAGLRRKDDRGRWPLARHIGTPRPAIGPRGRLAFPGDNLLPRRATNDPLCTGGSPQLPGSRRSRRAGV